MRKSLIVGLSGLELLPEERDFLSQHRPAGIILFSRNCIDPDQVRQLVADARAAIADREILVAIDQEGGRVQRLRPPHWRELPPASAFGSLYSRAPDTACRFARLIAGITADDLRNLGINANCAPVLDVPVQGAHDIIGNRAYGFAAGQVAALGRAVMDGYAAGGVLPIVKHVPGHGRAGADSHLELPVVTADRVDLETSDFAPFHALRDAPAAMTAHVVFTAYDSELPASTSLVVISNVIRGHIGFDGLLMSDDLGMKALAGDMGERARAVIGAGCDLALHCSGNLAEMHEAVSAVPVLAGRALHRFGRAFDVTRSWTAVDRVEAEQALAEVLDLAGARTGDPADDAAPPQKVS